MLSISARPRLRRLSHTALMTALIAVCAEISFPLPTGVPVTLQTFGVALCGAILEPLAGVCAVAAYLLLGICGIPVFAGFLGGVGVFLGKTGGFLWGFLFLAFFCGLATKIKNRFFGFLLSVFGLLLCHLGGVLQFSLLTGMDFRAATLAVSLRFLLKDVISLVFALKIANIIRKRIKSGN